MAMQRNMRTVPASDATAESKQAARNKAKAARCLQGSEQGYSQSGGE